MCYCPNSELIVLIECANPIREPKMTNKLIFAAIALGLWANAAISLIRPAEAESGALASIAHDIHTLVNGGANCLNKKICE